jgi:hypothetical protein
MLQPSEAGLEGNWLRDEKHLADLSFHLFTTATEKRLAGSFGLVWALVMWAFRACKSFILLDALETAAAEGLDARFVQPFSSQLPASSSAAGFDLFRQTWGRNRQRDESEVKPKPLNHFPSTVIAKGFSPCISLFSLAWHAFWRFGMLAEIGQRVFEVECVLPSSLGFELGYHPRFFWAGWLFLSFANTPVTKPLAQLCFLLEM